MTTTTISPELLQSMTDTELQSAARFFLNWSDNDDNARSLGQVEAEMERRARRSLGQSTSAADAAMADWMNASVRGA